MASIVKPLFPNVPFLRGVPNLPRSPQFPPEIQAILGIAEGAMWQQLTRGPVWGIFGADFVPVAYADSILDFDYRNESRISSFPVQNGSFANYNKVNNPYESRVKMVIGQTKERRQAFLTAVDKAAKSLDLYNIVTPERTFINANIQGYNYRREAYNGAYLLIVELELIEIRQVALKYSKVNQEQNKNQKDVSNAIKPESWPKEEQGRIQSKPPSDSFLKKASEQFKQSMKRIL
jgi:hypothetical protein